MACKIRLLAKGGRSGQPYKNNLHDISTSISFSWIISLTFKKRICLEFWKKLHLNKKWPVSSTPPLHRHLEVKVSAKLWRFLWSLNRPRPNLNWNMYLKLKSKMSKQLLAAGRTKEIRCFFNFSKSESLETMKLCYSRRKWHLEKSY